MIDILKEKGLKDFYGKITFEEKYYDPFDMVVRTYFILPAEVLDKRYLEYVVEEYDEEVDSACLQVEFPYIDGLDTEHPNAAIAATRQGEDFDWTDISLKAEDVKYLIKLILKDQKKCPV